MVKLMVGATESWLVQANAGSWRCWMGQFPLYVRTYVHLYTRERIH